MTKSKISDYKKGDLILVKYANTFATGFVKEVDKIEGLIKVASHDPNLEDDSIISEDEIYSLDDDNTT